ncbi:MAG: glycoside hydrolase family 3 C-terminal domain-containing protein, partial [Bacteroidaceae bacterium]|nr:glycoside hydrolase family 3 C-terminal domain-containing protein [Bacteroidaceae bacterium]
AIERLGIPQFDWWSEALHGVGRNGYSTTFPSCIGMAASFNPGLVEQVYTAVSDEARAKNTDLRKKGKVGKYQCLSFWTPNINIFRDPRWGRGQETYGEDVLMNSLMGQAVVRGLQGTSAGINGSQTGNKYLKLLACAKHFAVHSGPEKTRHSLDITTLSPRDLHETYLPAFKDLVTKSGVAEVMCAYQRFEGEPCCGSNKLLQQILRNDWGFKGLVVSDCGAISDFWREGRHHIVSTPSEAAAKGVIAGTDVECGSEYRTLDDAVKAGFITEEQINTSVLRLLELRFLIGEMDDDSLVEWTKIPMSVVNCKKHRELAREAARQSIVLLKNNGTLPLSSSAGNKRIMLMGPNAADSIMLWGIYYGQTPHSVTIKEGIENKIGSVAYNKGCELTTLTLDRSIFSSLTTIDGRPGIEASYWNNEQMQGEPLQTKVYNSPLSFDGGGDTAFEGGVNLFGFSARYKGKFTAAKDATIDLEYKYTSSLRLIVNGDTLMNRWKDDRYSYGSKQIKVKAGQEYAIQVDYKNRYQVASLGFDPKEKYATTVEEAVAAAKDAETIIFVGGISPLYEREETSVTTVGFDKGDRTSIELPQV